MPTPSEPESVAVEKEKTKRYFGLLIVGGFIAVLVIWLFFSMFTPGSGGKGDIEITKDGIKVSLEQPLIQQVDSATSVLRSADGEVPFTTGRIQKILIDSVVSRATKPTTAQRITITPERFVGSNLIDSKGGFVLSSKNATQWNVGHDDAGYANSSKPIVTLTSKNAEANTSVVVHRTPRSELQDCDSIRCAVHAIIAKHSEHNRITRVSMKIDDASNTALLSYVDVRAKSQTYIKVVLDKQFLYQAQYTQPAGRQQSANADALNIVTSFSVID